MNEIMCRTCEMTPLVFKFVILIAPLKLKNNIRVLIFSYTGYKKIKTHNYFFFRIAISITFSRPPLFFRRNALLLLLFSIILFFILRRGFCFVFASSMILSREIDSFLSSIAISKLLLLHLSLVPYDSDRCIYFQRRLFPNALGNYSMQIEDKEL